MTWPRLALLLTALGFLGFGAAYLLWPLPMARLTEIPLPSPTARIDFAATYGGVQLALGIFFLLASRRTAWTGPGLFAGAIVFAGLAAARILGLAATGIWPGGIILIALAIEIPGTIILGLGYRSVRHNLPR